MVWNVKFLDEVDKCWQLKASRVKLEFFLQVFHVILGEDGHHPLHMPLVILLFFEQ